MLAVFVVFCLTLHANAAASTCATSTTVCSHDGSGNYVSYTGLTYTASTGLFSGTLVTNGCPSFPYSNYTYSGTTYTSMGGAQPTCTTATINKYTAPAKGTPAAASLREKIGLTLTGLTIYGPFDNGFVLGEACTNNMGSCDSGTDVNPCFIQMQQQCGTNFLPQKGLDVCNGHANPYHHHMDFVCNYDRNATGHSALIGFAFDGRGIYGYKESSYAYPTDLDYCGGHYGPVPAFTMNGVTYPAGTNVYHYHTQPNAPFTLGCYGPVTTKAACMALYPGTCGTGYSTLTGVASDGKTTCRYSYDTDCPCFGKGLVYDYNQVCSVATTQTSKVTFTAWTTTAKTTSTTKTTTSGTTTTRKTTTTTTTPVKARKEGKDAASTSTTKTTTTRKTSTTTTAKTTSTTKTTTTITRKTTSTTKTSTTKTSTTKTLTTATTTTRKTSTTTTAQKPRI
ncbi:UNVERIFIED_CONTAM: hypothetical protein HDU68_010992 [Siphonaria sp. JEL0065]|nr:hypothetical protein HDU68_010992 [Siphonaria sp. JEL0065]